MSDVGPTVSFFFFFPVKTNFGTNPLALQKTSFLNDKRLLGFLTTKKGDLLHQLLGSRVTK